MSTKVIASCGAGFSDPVRDAQEAFRCIMSCMAEPGSISKINPIPGAPAGMGSAMAAVALTLCDFETPLWLDDSLGASRAVVDYLRLHTGARICAASGEAAFALVSSWDRLPEFVSFAPGSLDFPDTSTTIVLEVPVLEPTAGWRLSGPGIASSRALGIGAIPPRIETALRANREIFPRGLDFILCCGDKLSALPRTTRIEQGG